MSVDQLIERLSRLETSVVGLSYEIRASRIAATSLVKIRARQKVTP